MKHGDKFSNRLKPVTVKSFVGESFNLLLADEKVYLNSISASFPKDLAEFVEEEEKVQIIEAIQEEFNTSSSSHKKASIHRFKGIETLGASDKYICCGLCRRTYLHDARVKSGKHNRNPGTLGRGFKFKVGEGWGYVFEETIKKSRLYQKKR